MGVSFEATSLGMFMLIYAPVEYNLFKAYLMAFRTWRPRRHVIANLIEQIALNSENKAFRSIRFRHALMSFRRYGCKPRKKTHWCVKDAVYYARHSHRIHQSLKHCVGL